MSHFTVLAVTKDSEESSLETLFEPFDEGTSVEPYWTLEANTPKEFWAYAGFVEKGKVTADCSFEDLIKACAEEYGDETFRVNDEGKLERETTYNPKSKWDYWRIGGRWSGRLKLKDGVVGTVAARSWDSPGAVEPGYADQARKGDLDIDGMRQAAADRASERWDLFEQATAGLEKPKTWQQVMTEHQVDDKDIDVDIRKARLDVARHEYNGQPFIAALKEAGIFGFFGSYEDEFEPHTRTTYVEDARLGAVSGYAFLSEETGWLEPGRMGWWGMSTDDAVSRADFHKKVAEIVDALPEDAVLTMVDCHI